MEETVSKWGRIDVLVNNAAFQGKLVEKFEDIPRERLERTFHTNILVSLTTSMLLLLTCQTGPLSM